MSIEEMQCCAVKELSWISDLASEAEVLKYIARECYRAEHTTSEFAGRDAKGNAVYRQRKVSEKWCLPAFFIFTQVEPAKYGDNLEAAIKAHKLGAVTRTGPAFNPNSDNEVTVFTWQVDRKRFAEVGADRGWIKVKEPEAAF